MRLRYLGFVKQLPYALPAGSDFGVEVPGRAPPREFTSSRLGLEMATPAWAMPYNVLRAKCAASPLSIRSRSSPDEPKVVFYLLTRRRPVSVDNVAEGSPQAAGCIRRLPVFSAATPEAVRTMSRAIGTSRVII